MRCFFCVTIALATSCHVYAQESTSSTKTTPAKVAPSRPRAIPNPDWKPKPGDQVEVILDGAPACPDQYVYSQYVKSMQANDRTGMDKFLSSKAVVKLPRGVPVLVLQTFRPQPVATGGRVMSSQDFANSLLTASLAPKDTTIYPLEVRILDGDLKGMVRFIPEPCLAQMIPIPTRAKRRGVQKAAGTPPDPAKRAATLLTTGKNLEKLKRASAAAETYREIVKTYPGTAAAKAAEERLKSFKGK